MLREHVCLQRHNYVCKRHITRFSKHGYLILMSEITTEKKDQSAENYVILEDALKITSPIPDNYM